MFILDLLKNPLMLIAIVMPLALFIGVILGNSLGQPKKNRVLQFAPESGRAIDFNVREADALTLRCDPVGAMPNQRFIKTNDAYNVICKGFMKLKHYALWLGRIGTAYTFSLTDEKAPKLSFEVTTKHIFGDRYVQIPADIKTIIETAQIGVTVEFPKVPLTPEDMKSISSDDVRRGDVDHFINALARGLQKLTEAGAGEWTKVIFIMGTGIAIGIICSLIFGWGAPASPS